MSYFQDGIRPVHTQFGSRDTGMSAGFDCDFDELVIELTEAELANMELNAQTPFFPKIVIPKNVHFQRAVLTVHSAFTLGGTTPTITIGGAAPTTNGIAITAAQLNAVGAIDVQADLTGTWAPASTTGTTANEYIRVVPSAGSTLGTQGRATVWIEFRYKDRPNGGQPTPAV